MMNICLQQLILILLILQAHHYCYDHNNSRYQQINFYIKYLPFFTFLSSVPGLLVALRDCLHVGVAGKVTGKSRHAAEELGDPGLPQQSHQSHPLHPHQQRRQELHQSSLSFQREFDSELFNKELISAAIECKIFLNANLYLQIYFTVQCTQKVEMFQ